ncbi:hypothetical protein BU24DRAFT_417229 [Aaosphaeria arxii CBS 175.79]|uniref:Vacuolar ATPase assembly protein VMA22 n=1 Tax=Aaosphaeria arxii CBS 175.79 TaxID=1450172 RepID=A0A6A5Y9B1_9PLEO|nr:uncharacterized protein BU24DRAFT_417229 [Aaosphaeria arxii CBS 175.79]KAF2021597.1 hypothetical protein BU24DRAFT_417229 [Aaosphaeria arxii CBS 175.79]
MNGNSSLVAQDSPSKDAALEDGVDGEVLIAHLDKLLEDYLHALDEYQQLQQQLSACLASGYFSLAQANFKNPSRIRYGVDHYDDRMQSLRKISVGGDIPNLKFSIQSPSARENKASGPAENDKTSTRPSTEEETSDDHENAGEAAPVENKASSDPLKWFGILVPPELRNAQVSFNRAVEDPVPKLATAIGNLRRQEVEIGRLRKRIRKLGHAGF